MLPLYTQSNQPEHACMCMRVCVRAHARAFVRVWACVCAHSTGPASAPLLPAAYARTPAAEVALGELHPRTWPASRRATWPRRPSRKAGGAPGLGQRRSNPGACFTGPRPAHRHHGRLFWARSDMQRGTRSEAGARPVVGSARAAPHGQGHRRRARRPGRPPPGEQGGGRGRAPAPMAGTAHRRGAAPPRRGRGSRRPN